MKGTIQEYSEPRKKSIYDLFRGEVFLRGGSKFAFTRWKQGKKSYVATKLVDGESYGCRHYGETQVSVIGIWEAPISLTDIDKLKKGDLFTILHRRKDALLYRYTGEKTRSGKLKCINPLNKSKWTVDASFEIRLISSLEKESV